MTNRPVLAQAQQQPQLGISLGYEDAPRKQCSGCESHQRPKGIWRVRASDRCRPGRPSGLNHPQSFRPNFAQRDIRMRRHQNLAGGLMPFERLDLVGSELGDCANDPVRLEPMLDFVDQHNGAFGDRGLLDCERGQPPRTQARKSKRHSAVMEGD